MIKVCTGFSPKGYVEYGHKFLNTFHRYWPQNVDLVVYGEEPVNMDRGVFKALAECDGVTEFIERHRKDPEKNGKKPRKGWREREIAGGYSFKFDAVKFCRQCFIPEAASKDMADGDVLVWLDGDVITTASVPVSFVENLMQKYDLCFLGRTGTHSEIGFWAVRLNPGTRAFLKDFAEVWRSDAIFELTEWHSAFVFDVCRTRSKVSQIDLTPGGRGHVWMQSPLAAVSDHLKGVERKRAGFSMEKRRAR